MDGLILNWLKSYRSNRKQKVVLQGICSDTRNIYSGIPQSSVLCPLLFLINISDFDLTLTSLGFFFGGDSSLMFQYKPGDELAVSTRINKDLDQVLE